MKEVSIKKIILWILLLGWMALIFMLSNQNGTLSEKTSNGVLSFVSNTLSLHVSPFLIRKTAHAIEYTILSLLMILLIKEYRNVNFSIYIYVLFISVIYATSDELHQIFISGRSAQVLDVLIDTCGIIIGIFLHFIWSLRRKCSN